MNPKVDEFIAKAKKWREELEALRSIALDCGLNEDLKWGAPCYTLNGGNVILLHGFKEYCAILFFKGALLKDPEGILVQQTGNVQSARQIRFKSVRDIASQVSILKSYINEAAAIEKAGLKVELKKTEELNLPIEFQNKLDANPALKAAFEKLTPGRQRAYIIYFSAPKQSKTRESRIEKSVERILDGKGLDD